MSEAKKITKQIPNNRTRANFVSGSFNAESRTVEVVFATETAVRMFDWENWEMVDEVLVCMPENGDLTRLNNGAPALDNHNSYGKTADVVVGVVESARFENNSGIAKIRFGNTDDDTKLMEKVRDGIVTGVSVGYSVSEYQVTRKEGVKPVYRATKWEATEISFTPVQADVNSRVRNEDKAATHEATIIEETQTDNNTNNENNNEMSKEVTEAAAAAAPATPAAAAQPAAAAPATPAAAGDDSTRSAATIEERTRVLGIQQKVRLLGLDDDFAQTLITEGVSVDVASTRALAKWEEGNPLSGKQNAQQDATEADRKRAAMSNAIALRVNPSAATAMGPENVAAAAQYRGMSFLRFAEEALMDAGIKTRGYNPRELATLALGGRVRGMLATTDFPLLLMDTVNRTLLASYVQQPRTFMKWARRVTISDFRPITRARLSEIFGNLDKVREGEEYKYASMSESGETYQLAKFGKIIGITWEAIVNDDLSAFTRIPQAFASKAAINQSNIVYKVIMEDGFANMSDGKRLFSSDHKNFTGTANNQTTGGTALSEASLDAAYQLFETQTDAAGDFISVSPSFLVVGPKNKRMALKLTSANFVPTTQLTQAPDAFLGLEVIVDPRITGTQWFLIANPNQIDTVEYAFLDGEEELFIEQREGFNIDGIEVKARMVFAAKAIDWRGMYRNNGA